METLHEVTENNIESETYYNLCKLADITRFSNPITALRVNKESVWVVKDSAGNITRGATEEERKRV